MQGNGTEHVYPNYKKLYTSRLQILFCTPTIQKFLAVYKFDSAPQLYKAV